MRISFSHLLQQANHIAVKQLHVAGQSQWPLCILRHLTIQSPSCPIRQHQHLTACCGKSHAGTLARHAWGTGLVLGQNRWRRHRESTNTAEIAGHGSKGHTVWQLQWQRPRACCGKRPAAAVHTSPSLSLLWPRPDSRRCFHGKTELPTTFPPSTSICSCHPAQGFLVFHTFQTQIWTLFEKQSNCASHWQKTPAFKSILQLYTIFVASRIIVLLA